MHITFLGHSGFLVETERRCLLFDWSEGELPPLPDKPMTVFASHRHADHFRRDIFAPAEGRNNMDFVLGCDIRLTPQRAEKWGVAPEIHARCRVMNGGETFAADGITVESLPSTDEGVAFLVTCDGHTIYHAGDLNWWHWEGEGPAWNRAMEADFKRYIEPLRGRHIDLAFAPLDPRQEDAAHWGFLYLLELADIDRIVPMHQWKNPRPTQDFCEKFPVWAKRILPMETAGGTAEV